MEETSQLTISLFGGLEVLLAGKPVQDSFESDKVRALLAYLAEENGRVHRREKLAGLLWPELPERRARRNLSQALYNLRQVLQDDGHQQEIIHSSPQTIQLNEDGLWRLDTAEFCQAFRGCRHHHPALKKRCSDCMAQLQQAVDLCRGPFLDGFFLNDAIAFDEWCLLQRERLQRRVQRALAKLVRWHQEQGNANAALRNARRGVRLDPLWEPAQRRLMRSLWLGGRRSEALAQYALCREMLRVELGVTPDEQTKALLAQIEGDAQPAMPERTTADPVSLPHHLTPFVGRGEELAQLEECLLSPDCRLLTVLGPGGSGKTRLAIEAARRVQEQFPDGVYLVPLSGLESVGTLLPKLGEMLDIPFSQVPDPEEALLNYLREKEMLLVMDSFEELLGETGLLLDLLRETVAVKAMVTSRARLNVKGEHVYFLGGLPYPKHGAADVSKYESVQLFLSAAHRVRLDYAPPQQELAQISRICRQVEGLPLGVLLATAWLEVLAPAQIADEIDKSLDFLAVEWRDLPPRQRSLRAMLDSSWQLLGKREQELFAALSVFQGGFTHEAARQVAGVTARDFLQLVRNAFLVRGDDDRYTIHDMLHHYAAEQLAADPAQERKIRQRHGEFYLALLAGREEGLQGPAQTASLTALQADYENLRRAWRWGCAHSLLPDVQKSLDPFCIFHDFKSWYGEGADVCARALAQVEQSDAAGDRLLLAARLQIWHAHFLRLLGRLPEAEEALKKVCS